MRSLQDRLRDRIDLNESKLRKLDLEFHKACYPAGIKDSTSYNDYDTIHGSKKELHVPEWYEAKRKLIVQIDLDQQILESIIDGVEDEEYLNLLETIEQKVAYCRIVQGYTQAKTAELIGLSERHVRRIEQKI